MNRARFLLLVFVSMIQITALSQEADSEFMNLVNESARLRAESKYDSALYLMQELTLQAKEADDNEFLSRAALEMCVSYFETEKFDFALDMANEAIKYAERAGRERLRMTAVYNIGRVMRIRENYDSAMYFYNQAEQYFRSSTDTMMLGVVLSGISGIYELTGENLKSIEVSKESAFFYSQAKKYDYLAMRIFFIGENFLILAQEDTIGKRNVYLDSADFYYNESFELSDSLDFPVPKYRSLRGLAVVNEMWGNYQEALQYMYQSNNVTQNLYSSNIEDKLLEFREKYNTANLEIEALRQQRNKNIILVFGLAIIVFVTVWLVIIDQRRKSIKALSEKNDEINKQKIDELIQEQEIASLQGVLEGQETERKRIASDLHDRLGGILSMVKLHFSALEETVAVRDPDKDKFSKASDLLDNAAGEVRNISHNLMSGVLTKFGLVPALEDLKSKISGTGKLRVNLFANNINGSLSSEQELQLYRIVQELMSNILKHADADEANIQLNGSDGNMNLIVEDDGVGFDPGKKQGGIGLVNLKARVTKLDGSFHIDSGKGAGTSVSIDIPVSHD